MVGSSAEQIVRLSDPRTILALVLSAVAGYIDAVGYVLWDKVLVANMSGNTIEFAAKTAERTFPSSVFRLWPLVLFVIGVLCGSLIQDSVKRRRPTGSISVALGVELALLVSVVLAAVGLDARFVRPEDGARWFVPVALGAYAMGLQNATLTRVGPVHVYTTHVTGTLTKFGQDLVDSLYCVRDARASGKPTWRTLRHSKAFTSMLFFFGMFALFATFGAVGAWAQVHFGIWSLTAAIAVIGLTTVFARKL